jgi:hypothetical protein
VLVFAQGAQAPAARLRPSLDHQPYRRCSGSRPALTAPRGSSGRAPGTLVGTIAPARRRTRGCKWEINRERRRRGGCLLQCRPIKIHEVPFRAIRQVWHDRRPCHEKRKTDVGTVGNRGINLVLGETLGHPCSSGPRH